MSPRVLLLVALAACQPEPEPDATEIPEMDSEALLTRISLDLRGVRPDGAELQRVADDPAELDVLIDEYLDDPRFERRVMEWYSEVYLTRIDDYVYTYYFTGIDRIPFNEAVGEEPVRLVAHVAANDRPWQEIVTADYTLANEHLGAAWPLDYPEGETGWREVQYDDGRLHAGVLSSNALMWRYQSTLSNANRKRANAISRILLCNDYLVRPIDFDRNVNLLDEESVNNALQENPACVNCHVTLDPLASYFYGYWTYFENSAMDASTYHPERELLWADITGVPPSYYGDPGESLLDLGYQIASDNRFVECAVEQTWGFLLRRDATLDDTDRLTVHREAFREGDWRYKDLVRSIVHDPLYRAGVTDDPGAVPVKLATPDLLGSQVEDLTGFRWKWQRREMLFTDNPGVRTLAGGADGDTVSRNATEPNATLVLVQQRLAEAGASYAIATEVEQDASERRLFREIDFTETTGTDRAAMAEQMAALHLRVLGNRVATDSEEVEAGLALWDELYGIEDDVPTAWGGVLYALLRDPELLLY